VHLGQDHHRDEATFGDVQTNPWLDRRILNWAHQGGAKEGPSSTLFAMRQAVANGADALELDVHMSKDGVLMVCHDATVDRTTDGAGAIADLTLDELRRLDNAYWWTPGTVVDHENPDPDAYVHRGKAADDPDFRIATLEEVLEAFPGVFLNFDIKQTAPAVASYEQPLAEALLRHDRVGSTIVASFNDLATDRFREHAPQIHTSLGTNGTAAFYQAFRAGEAPPATPSVALQVPRTFGDIVVVDEDFVAAAHRAGLAVHVWTIDDKEELASLAELGVDGIMTDRPLALEAVLRDKDVRFGG
jgi:glycerophosphoryl diester phosphodiesterase